MASSVSRCYLRLELSRDGDQFSCQDPVTDSCQELSEFRDQALACSTHRDVLSLLEDLKWFSAFNKEKYPNLLERVQLYHINHPGYQAHNETEGTKHQCTLFLMQMFVQQQKINSDPSRRTPEDKMEVLIYSLLSLPEIRDLLRDGTVEVTSDGERQVHFVTPFQGIISLPRLAKSIEQKARDHCWLESLNLGDRIAGLEITQRIRALYQDTEFTRACPLQDCDEETRLHFGADQRVEKYFKGFSKKQYTRIFGTQETVVTRFEILYEIFFCPSEEALRSRAELFMTRMSSLV